VAITDEIIGVSQLLGARAKPMCMGPIVHRKSSLTKLVRLLCLCTVSLPDVNRVVLDDI